MFAAARIVSHAKGRSECRRSGRIWSLKLGDEGRKTVTLVCPLPTEPDKVVVPCRRAAHRPRGARARAGAAGGAQPRRALAGEPGRGAGGRPLPRRGDADAARHRPPHRPDATCPCSSPARPAPARRCSRASIHAYSTRAESTFLPFNCTATPKDMLDSQLFGHRRGSFTGATEHFPGVIRAAAGGTLFLDEIGETTLDVQPKLLRFLESSEVHPIGETQPVTRRRPRHRRHQRRPRRPASPGPLPRRPLLPPQHRPPPRAAAARAPRRDPRPRAPLPAASTRRNAARATCASPKRRWSTWCSIAGPATSGSWPTRCGAWPRSPNRAPC